MEILSRGMTSCGGISKTIVLNETRTIRSMGQKTRIIPGPLALGSNRPSRKMTPRSYSLNILMELMRYSAAKNRRMELNEMENWTMDPPLFLFFLPHHFQKRFNNGDVPLARL